MGWHFDFLESFDGLAIRWGVSAATASSARGTVLFLNGRTEWMEKYTEVVEELNQRGFEVYSCDWRGQGLSGRLLDDRRKGHVGRFEEYLKDLDRLLAILDKRGVPGPHILLGHSMGGHLALRYLARRPGRFARVVLSSPMIDIQLPRFLSPAILRWTVRAALFAGLQGAYVPGSNGTPVEQTQFEDNPLTSDRMRFERSLAMLRRDPRLAVGGVTYGWLAAALQSINLLRSPSFARNLDVPVLMVTASEDKIVCPQAQVQFCRDLPQGRLVRIQGARHELLVETDERRAQFWSAWDRFLAAG
jgi:lysophospholipase